MEDLGPVGEDESEIDIGWRLLAHPRQRRQDDQLWLTLDRFDDRYPFDPFFGDQPPEHGRFKNPEPDIKPHADHDDAGMNGMRQPQTRNRSPENRLNTSTAMFASSAPA